MLVPYLAKKCVKYNCNIVTEKAGYINVPLSPKRKKYKKLDSPTIKKLEASFSTTTTSNGLHTRMSLKDSKTDYFTRIPKFLSPHHSLFIYDIISILTPRLLVCSLLQRTAVEVPLVGTEWRLGQGTSRAGWCRMPWERDCRLNEKTSTNVTLDV